MSSIYSLFGSLSLSIECVFFLSKIPKQLQINSFKNLHIRPRMKSFCYIFRSQLFKGSSVPACVCIYVILK